MIYQATGRFHRNLSVGILGVSVALLAAGYSPYGSGQNDSSDSHSSAITSDLRVVSNGQGKHAVVYEGSSGSSDASNAEKLIIADQGCFHSTTQHGAPSLLIFPQGIEITVDGRPAIKLDDDDSYPVGALLTFTGRKVSLSEDQLDQILPCVPHGEVFQVTDLSR